MKEKMIEKMIGKQIGKMTERVRMGLNKTHFRRKQFWDVNAALLSSNWREPAIGVFSTTEKMKVKMTEKMVDWVRLEAQVSADLVESADEATSCSAQRAYSMLRWQLKLGKDEAFEKELKKVIESERIP